MLTESLLVISIISFVTIRKTRVYFFVILLILAGIELLIALMLAYPQLSPHRSLDFLRSVYFWHYRSLIQDEPKFARYDPYLNYTLRPGKFIYSNSEYANEFNVNSLGLRDEEPSLSRPDMVVLGDSIPMGTGVDQNETFAKQIEKISGLKVLNAAVSGYSTVEAMRILDRIDTSNMKYLVIYYQYWDYPENVNYFKLKDAFHTMDADAYKKEVSTNQQSKKYYPGKYLQLVYFQIRQSILEKLHLTQPAVRPDPSQTDQAKAFMYIVTTASHKDLRNTKLIIICDPHFMQSVTSELATRYPLWQDNIVIINPIEITGIYAYILDDHPRANWHQKMAERILDGMRKKWGNEL